MSISALDCITRKKVTADTYEGRKIYCPDCPEGNNKVKYVPASDKHVAYLAHVKLHADNPCKRFNINPSETDEHLFAKNDMIRLYREFKKFGFKRMCNLYPYQKCQNYKLIELQSSGIHDDPKPEHKFDENKRFRSDISILRNGKLFFIIEIHHTNPTKVENRPDDIDWVEITTEDIFNINYDDDVIILNCERDYACEDCLNKQEIEKQKELEKLLKLQKMREEKNRLKREELLKNIKEKEEKRKADEEEKRKAYEERIEKEIIEKEEKEEKRKADEERIEKERIEKEEKRKADEERIEKERIEKEIIEKEEKRIKELQQEQEKKEKDRKEKEKKEKDRIWRENYEKNRIINERNNAIEKVLKKQINKFKKNERERKKQIKYQKGLHDDEYKEIILNDKLYVLTREDDLIFTCDGDFVGYYINGELDIPVDDYD